MLTIFSAFFIGVKNVFLPNILYHPKIPNIMQNFVHLHVHSQYSILDGASSVEGLVTKAKETGMPAIALTDHGTMFGIKHFHEAAKKQGVKPILGMEAYVAKGESRHKKQVGIDRSGYHLILLAKNEVGYKNLVKLCSYGYTEGFYYKPRIDRELLEKYHVGNCWRNTTKGLL